MCNHIKTNIKNRHTYAAKSLLRTRTSISSRQNAHFDCILHTHEFAVFSNILASIRIKSMSLCIENCCVCVSSRQYARKLQSMRFRAGETIGSRLRKGVCFAKASTQQLILCFARSARVKQRLRCCVCIFAHIVEAKSLFSQNAKRYPHIFHFSDTPVCENCSPATQNQLIGF